MTIQLKLNTKFIAFIAIFAALYTVLGCVPLFYIFGSYGTFITAALLIAPIIGIVLGPVGGALSVTIGGLAGMAITGNAPMGIFTFLPGMFDALCTGLTFRGKRYVSAIIFGAFIIAFAALPSIDGAIYFIWLHVIALFLLLSPAPTLAVKYIKTFNPQKLVLGVGILAFIGVLEDHIVGNFIYQSIIAPLPPSVWEAVAFVYPVERLLATIGAAIIGAAVIRGVKATGLTLGEAIA
jgi:uncharacterized membrane protein